MFKPSSCPHCEYDRRFPETAMGGWLYFGNNGPYVPCPLCNDDGSWLRVAGADTPTALPLDGEWNERGVRNPGGCHEVAPTMPNRDMSKAGRDEPAPAPADLALTGTQR